MDVFLEDVLVEGGCDEVVMVGVKEMADKLEVHLRNAVVDACVVRPGDFSEAVEPKTCSARSAGNNGIVSGRAVGSAKTGVAFNIVRGRTLEGLAFGDTCDGVITCCSHCDLTSELD